MRVLRNYFYSIGYQMLNMILPLITGPYIARVLGPTGVGINSYTGAVIQYFVLFGGLGIGLYGNRQIAYVKNDAEKLSITFWEIQLIKIFTVFLAYIFFVVYLICISQYRWYMFIQSLYIVATGFDISWLYEGIEDFKRTFTRNTLVRLISFILIMLFVRKSTDIWLYILILAISNLGGYIALWPSLRKIIIPIRLKQLRPFKHLSGIWLLFIPYLTLNIYPVINKTLLKHFVGIDSSGYYEKSDVMIRMALTIVTSISAVLLPHTSRAFAEGKIKLIKKMLKDSFGFVSMLAFPITFGLAAIAPKFGLFFYGSGFEPVGRAMFIEAFAVIFMGWSSIIGNQYLIPTRQSKYYTHSVLLGSVLNIIFDIPLIFIWGLNGAALATVLGEAAIAIYQLVVIRKQVNYYFWLADLLKYFVASVLMFLVVFLVNRMLIMNIWNFMFQIFLGLLIYGWLLVLMKPTPLKLIKTTIKQIFKKL